MATNLAARHHAQLLRILCYTPPLTAPILFAGSSRYRSTQTTHKPMKTNTYLHLMTTLSIADILALSQLTWTAGEALAIGTVMTLNVALTLRYALR